MIANAWRSTPSAARCFESQISFMRLGPIGQGSRRQFCSCFSLERKPGIRCIRQHCKAGTSPNRGSHLDLVLKKLCCTADDEQSEPKSFRLRRLEATERLEDLAQAFRRNPNAGVVNLDANGRSRSTASKKNPSAWGRVFHRVPCEISDSASQQDRVACDHCSCGDYAQLHPSLGSKVAGLLADD